MSALTLWILFSLVVAFMGHNNANAQEADQFRCANGLCLDKRRVCDGYPDCSDQSDEQNCSSPPCYEPNLLCGHRCIQEKYICDDIRDCDDGEDESNCQKCQPDEFSCEDSRGLCIPLEYKCNGNSECENNADELDCPHFQKSCRAGEFACGDGSCMPNRYYCDGHPQCSDHSDEKECGTCADPDWFLCGDGACLASTFRCDNYYNCRDFSDEQNCFIDVAPTAKPPVPCGPYEATCSNGDCIPKNLVCNGNFDCSDGSDEMQCNPHGCEPNEFRCANKQCISKMWRCDSDDNCGDNSDEQGCATNPPGSPCKYHEFACQSGKQCIPKSHHCDQSEDCMDGSDEIGCSPVTIVKPPPPMIHLENGQTFEISCTAIGIPVPEITWRFNMEHIPEKCRTTSVNGVGTLTCPNIQESDQGAYSCESINIKGTVFAVPDTILTVAPPSGVCHKGSFNDEATNPTECMSCFCFDVTKECNSANLFTYSLQEPIDSHKILGVKIDRSSGVVDIRDEPIYKETEYRITQLPYGRNGIHAQLDSPRAELLQADVVLYLAMPENYHGNQLKSYGGYIKYNLMYEGYGQPTSNAPDIILTGNGYTLMHHIGYQHEAGREEPINIRFFVGEWVKRSLTAPESMATREELMMALAQVDQILIKMQYVNGHLDTILEGIEMDSAAVRNTGLGQATFVEECRCPVGYGGLSCESCASGYSRHRSGHCYKEEETCQPGYYGDPSRGILCQPCNCPYNLAKTCHLDSDGDMTCDCLPECVGRRCEGCAQGYSLNSLIYGDYCKPENCSVGALEESPAGGQCYCKPNTDGPTCDQCKKNSFYLSADNQFGCISCFCMGITNQCFSSNWYRDQISSVFTRSKNEFKLVELNSKHTQIEDGIILDQNSREIVYNNFRRPDVYYWSLPSRFLGNKITAYGGFLRYSLRYVPSPGGQSSKNNAPDVELISHNRITLTYFARDQPLPNNVQTITVPLLEQHWQRSDGQKADREHIMMALADLEAILIKATYTTNTRETALQSVSLDIADERNTGNERASAVEQCQCPTGYKGLSCEDCDAGYSRTIDGIYLGRCEKCQCNGHSNECDPETGECFNCREHTTGENCEQCIDGYEGNPTERIPCSYNGGSSLPCKCDPRGSISNDCVGGICQCKTNIEGNNCDRCRDGTFGLNGSIAEGCQPCFCSGVSTQCYESNLYIEQISSQIFDPERHGFTLTDRYQNEKITNNFQLNIAMNEIGYTFRPSTTDRLFWSLPSTFTGYKIKSYGGKLEFTQRYTQRPDARYIMDQDIIMMGNGITIYWTNPVEQRPNIANKVSVTLSPSSKWQRLDFRQDLRPASREDILKVLANLNAILIRAQLSSDTVSSFISNLSLDTAADFYTGQSKATNVEVCVCPSGYSGTSCEICAPGHYRDINDLSKGPLGSCSRCPCNGREVSCKLGPENSICNCLPGYVGQSCENTESEPRPRPPPVPPGVQSLPSSPKLTISEVGIEVTFNCSAVSIARNNVRIQWSKADGHLPDRAIDDRRGLLVITDLKMSDSGHYVCKADDGVSVVSKYVNLEVDGNREESPRVQIQPSFLEVNVGDPINLHCQAGGNPEPTLQWAKVNRDPLNLRHTFTNGIFRVENAVKDDEGEYECTARNSAGIETARTIVHVKDVPDTSVIPANITFKDTGVYPNVNIEPTSQKVLQGSNVVIHCNVSGSPTPQVKWTKLDDPWPTNVNPTDPVLKLYNVQMHDRGVYICVANNNLGMSRSYSVLEIEPREAPIIEIHPNSSQTVTSGGNALMQCRINAGIPQPTLRWHRQNGQPLSQRIEQLNNGLLRFMGISEAEAGEYICTAENEAGRVTAVGNIIVQTQPVVVINPTRETLTVQPGEFVSLECRATGSPTPTVQWSKYKSDSQHAYASKISLSGEDKNVAVYEISYVSQDDEGVYTCLGRNDAGETEGRIMLHVDNRDNIPSRGSITGNDIGDAGDARPSFKSNEHLGNPHVIDEQTFSVPLGNQADLRCQIENSENEQIYTNWMRADNSSLPQYSEIRNGTLVITNAQPSDAGEYHCLGISATRGDIIFVVIAHLQVLSPPRITLNPAKQVVRPGDNAVVECLTTGEQPISIKWIGLNRTMPDSVNVQGRYLQFRRIQTHDAGRYRCTAINSVGEADAVAEVIVQENIQQFGSTVTLPCNLRPEQSHLPIRWYKENDNLPDSSRSDGHRLIINDIQPHHSGRYFCEVITENGSTLIVSKYIVMTSQQFEGIEIASHTHKYK